MSDYVPVRCPEHRPHGNNDNCGRLLCVLKDGIVYLYCPMCQEFMELTVLSNDNVMLAPLPKKTRFDLKNRLRLLKR